MFYRCYQHRLHSNSPAIVRKSVQLGEPVASYPKSKFSLNCHRSVEPHSSPRSHQLSPALSLGLKHRSSQQPPRQTHRIRPCGSLGATRTHRCHLKSSDSHHSRVRHLLPLSKYQREFQPLPRLVQGATSLKNSWAKRLQRLLHR